MFTPFATIKHYSSKYEFCLRNPNEGKIRASYQMGVAFLAYGILVKQLVGYEFFE